MPTSTRTGSTLVVTATAAALLGVGVSTFAAAPTWSQGPNALASSGSPSASGSPSTGPAPSGSTLPTTSPSPTTSPTTSPSPSPTGSTPTPTQPTPPKAPGLLEMEEAFERLGIPTGMADGVDSPGTRRGVCAFRDLSGMTTTRKKPNAALFAKAVAMKKLPAVPASLRRIKALVNLTCQTAYITNGRGKILRVLPVSTGMDNGLHRTRPGVNKVYYRYDGWQASSLFPEPDGRPGLYRPIYFDGGIAFHGVRKPVRTVPESHGCVRTWPQDQDWLWQRLKVGNKVYVYGDYWRNKVAPFGGR